MRPDSPSSPEQSTSPSDAEDYPVWKRWGDLDEHNRSKGRSTGEAASGNGASHARASDPNLEQLKQQILNRAAQSNVETDAARSQETGRTRLREPESKSLHEPERTATHEQEPAATHEPELSRLRDSGPANLVAATMQPDEVEPAASPDRRSWESDFSALDIRDRVVIMLLFKQVVKIEEVEAAWHRFQSENQGRSREPLWRILARDPNFDRDRILVEAARTAGYEPAEIDLNKASMFIQGHFASFSKNEWERMLDLVVVPIGREENPKTGRERLVFVASDPTRPGVAKLLRDLKVDGFVLRYAPERLIDRLLASLSEPAVAEEKLHIAAESKPSNNVEPSSAAEEHTIHHVPPPVVDETPESVGEAAHVRMPASEAAPDPIERDPPAPPAAKQEERAPAKSDAARELFEACLKEAVNMSASGIHLLPVEEGIQIDMRVDGELERWRNCPRPLGDDLLSVVKESALNIKPTEIDTVQDGMIKRQIGDLTVQFRVSVLPIAGGWSEDRRESVVISLIGDEASTVDLEALGLPGEVLDHLRTAVAEPRGMVVLAGPSGSGRSTTLNAVLQEIVTPKLNVITLEESISHAAQGVRQVRLSHRLDHEDALEAVRRHDPDIILVGELRSKGTAELALKLANAGHLVFSRVPANDTTGVIGRLFRLGVDPFLTAYAINLIVAQRLVRRLCPDCKQPAKHVDGELLRRLGFSRQEIASTTFYAEGSISDCPTCGGRRYQGTQIVAEAMPFTHDTRRLIALADSSFDEEDARAQAVREGMTTIRTSARGVVVSGATSVDELIRATAGGS